MFDLNTQVTTKEGVKRIADLKQNDEILSLNPHTLKREYATVKLKIITSSVRPFYYVTGSFISSYHPVRTPFSSKFFWPIDLMSKKVYRANGVDLVISKNHIIVLQNEVVAVTYAHQYNAGNLHHAFFSTSACVREASRYADSTGNVSIIGFKRGRAKGLVVGFDFEKKHDRKGL